jgi:hypothetical protein
LVKLVLYVKKKGMHCRINGVGANEQRW